MPKKIVALCLFFLWSASAALPPNVSVVQNFTTVQVEENQVLTYNLDFIFSGINVSYNINGESHPRIFQRNVAVADSTVMSNLKVMKLSNDQNPVSIAYFDSLNFVFKVINSTGYANQTESFTQVIDTDINISCHDFAELSIDGASICDCRNNSNTAEDVFYVIDYSTLPPKTVPIHVNSPLDSTLQTLTRKVFSDGDRIIRFTSALDAQSNEQWQVDVFELKYEAGAGSMKLLSSVSSQNETAIKDLDDKPASFEYLTADIWLFYNTTQAFTYNASYDQVLSRVEFPGSLNIDLSFSASSEEEWLMRTSIGPNVTIYSITAGIIESVGTTTFASPYNSTIVNYVNMGDFNAFTSLDSRLTISPADSTSVLARYQNIYYETGFSGDSLKLLSISDDTFLLCTSSSIDAFTMNAQLLKIQGSSPQTVKLIATSSSDQTDVQATLEFNVEVKNTTLNLTFPDAVAADYPSRLDVPFASYVQGSDYNVTVSNCPGNCTVDFVNPVGFATNTSGIKSAKLIEVRNSQNTVNIYYQDPSNLKVNQAVCTSSNNNLTCDSKATLPDLGVAYWIAGGASSNIAVASMDENNQNIAIYAESASPLEATLTLSFPNTGGVCDILHVSRSSNQLFFCWSELNATLYAYNIATKGATTPAFKYTVSNITDIETSRKEKDLVIISTYEEIQLLNISGGAVKVVATAVPFSYAVHAPEALVFAAIDQIWVFSFTESLILRWELVNNQLISRGAINLNKYVLTLDLTATPSFYIGEKHVFVGVYNQLNKDTLLALDLASGTIALSQVIGQKFIVRASHLDNTNEVVVVWTEDENITTYRVNSNPLISIETLNIPAASMVSRYNFTVNVTSKIQDTVRSKNATLVLYAVAQPIYPKNPNHTIEFELKDVNNSLPSMKLDPASIFNGTVLDLKVFPDSSSKKLMLAAISGGEASVNVSISKPINHTAVLDAQKVVTTMDRATVIFRNRSAYFLGVQAIGAGYIDTEHQKIDKPSHQNIQVFEPSVDGLCGLLSVAPSGNFTAFACGKNLYKVDYNMSNYTAVNFSVMDQNRQKNLLKVVATSDLKVFTFYNTMNQPSYPVLDIYDNKTQLTATLTYDTLTKTCTDVAFDPSVLTYGLEVFINGNGTYKVFISNYKGGVLLLDITVSGSATNLRKCMHYNITEAVMHQEFLTSPPVWEQFKVIEELNSTYLSFIRSNNSFVYFLTLPVNAPTPVSVQEAYLNYFHDSVTHLFEKSASNKLITLVSVPMRPGQDVDQSYVFLYEVGKPNFTATSPFKYVHAVQYLNLNDYYEGAYKTFPNDFSISYDDESSQLLVYRKEFLTVKLSQVSTNWTLNFKGAKSNSSCKFTLQGENFAAKYNVSVETTFTFGKGSGVGWWIALGIVLLLIAGGVGYVLYQRHQKKKEADKPLFYESTQEFKAL